MSNSQDITFNEIIQEVNFKTLCEEGCRRYDAGRYETIEIVGENNILRIEAMTDDTCSSESWFEEWDNVSIAANLIGHIIVELNLDDDMLDMPPSNFESCDQNYLHHFLLENGETVPFVLRNASNGYYDGWIQTRIVRKPQSD